MTGQDPHIATSQTAYLSATELAAQLADGVVSSESVVDELLSRIGAVDARESAHHLQSVLAVASDALDVARDRDHERAAGRSRGPLHGVPVLIKDNIQAQGLPGTAGSMSLAHRPVAADAPLVARLREAGAIILGSTNLSEWANIRSPHSSSGWSAVGGLTGNPWALDRSAGGSSSGSGAAVAAGLAPLAVGTETDGSIVCPGSLNGVVGIKPTVGRVATLGVVPISASQDSPGPMARSVADAALMLEILMGSPGLRDEAAHRDDLCIGAMQTYRTAHPGTDNLFDEVCKTLRGSGVRLCDVAAEVPDGAVGGDELTVLLCELRDGLNEYLPTRGPDGPQTLDEVIAFEDAHAAAELAHFGHEFFIQAAASGGCASEEYQAARKRNLTWAVETCLMPAIATCDVLIAPSYAPAWKIDLTNGDQGLASPVTRPAAIAGWPIGTLPMGLVDGLPVGLAVIARPGQESTLIAAMTLLEARLASAGIANLRPHWGAPTRG